MCLSFKQNIFGVYFQLDFNLLVLYFSFTTLNHANKTILDFMWIRFDIISIILLDAY